MRSPIQNFLSANELDIPEKYRHALLLALDALERGEVVEATPEPPSPNWPLRFSMTIWSCGTVCCIGGLAEILGKLERYEIANYFNKEALQADRAKAWELYWLFHPTAIPSWRWRKITIEQAAQALRNYLLTGKAEWGKLFPELCRIVPDAGRGRVDNLQNA